MGEQAGAGRLTAADDFRRNANGTSTKNFFWPRMNTDKSSPPLTVYELGDSTIPFLFSYPCLSVFIRGCF
jgi:uncharacterized protein (DUF1810 family)